MKDLAFSGRPKIRHIKECQIFHGKSSNDWCFRLFSIYTQPWSTYRLSHIFLSSFSQFRFNKGVKRPQFAFHLLLVGCITTDTFMHEQQDLEFGIVLTNMFIRQSHCHCLKEMRSMWLYLSQGQADGLDRGLRKTWKTSSGIRFLTRFFFSVCIWNRKEWRADKKGSSLTSDDNVMNEILRN